jgi:predicted transcriptional regulator
METEMTTERELLRMAVDIVSAYVARNDVAADTLPDVIATVYEALSGLETPAGAAAVGARQPAVTVGRSVKRKSIVCLEDGKTFKALKRHLRTAHDLTPDEYRSKWGLQDNYPMVAPDYSAKRSELAKKMGLGQKAERRGSAASNVTEAA